MVYMGACVCIGQWGHGFVIACHSQWLQRSYVSILAERTAEISLHWSIHTLSSSCTNSISIPTTNPLHRQLVHDLLMEQGIWVHYLKNTMSRTAPSLLIQWRLRHLGFGIIPLEMKSQWITGMWDWCLVKEIHTSQNKHTDVEDSPP